jgi:hypothetical protein
LFLSSAALNFHGHTLFLPVICIGTRQITDRSIKESSGAAFIRKYSISAYRFNLRVQGLHVVLLLNSSVRERRQNDQERDAAKIQTDFGVVNGNDQERNVAKIHTDFGVKRETTK